MYNLFKKQLKTRLKDFFEDRGFVQVRDGIFVSFVGELFFMIRFEKAGYGSRIELQYLIEAPLVKADFSKRIEEMAVLEYAGETIDCSTWKINEKGLNAKEKKERVMRYVSEIEYIYDNYLYYIFSKEANQYDTEKYILEEYENRFAQHLSDKGEEDPCWQYMIDFASSGKSMDEWTEEDSKKCAQLVEEKKSREFPYEKIHTRIIKDMERNSEVYRNAIMSLTGGRNIELVIDKDVLPVTLDMLYERSLIQKFLIDYGFILNPDKGTNGLSNYGETHYYNNTSGDCELKLTISKELFVFFDLSCNDSHKRICLFKDQFFWFGWLLGKESVMKKNIEIALNELKKAFEEFNITIRS